MSTRIGGSAAAAALAVLLCGSIAAGKSEAGGFFVLPEENPRFVVYDLPPAEIEA
ncbi:MAG: hypothetical protein FJY73_10915, partial [Candidatus Eisenbacteria bacterium]|nr:hypothetical protein [Candidatus Eisenbacteria bacterium]